jgi:hypothetical protein
VRRPRRRQARVHGALLQRQGQVRGACLLARLSSSLLYNKYLLGELRARVCVLWTERRPPLEVFFLFFCLFHFRPVFLSLDFCSSFTNLCVVELKLVLRVILFVQDWVQHDHRCRGEGTNHSRQGG